MKKRVMITGIGMITSAGEGIQKNWDALIEGRSGIGTITSFDASAYPTRIAAEVKNFNINEYINDRKIIRLLQKGDSYGMAAAKMAIDDSGLQDAGIDLSNGGIFIGSGKETSSINRLFGSVKASVGNNGKVDRYKFGIEAMKQVYPLFIVESLPNACLYYISQIYKIKGINCNIPLSGTASSIAIGFAFHSIQHGESKFIVAGGFDSHIDPINFSSFTSFGILSKRNNEYEKAFKPFDRTRDGFVLGEGAGIVILEELEHALSRGAKIYAELTGFGSTNDASGLLKTKKNRHALSIAINKALTDANLSPEKIDYINAHGNATPSSDKLETLAIKDIFGKNAYNIPISSIKPVIGHLITASGVIELISTVLTIKNNRIPPTINYENPDHFCDLDYVPNKYRDKDIYSAISINRDMGGSESVLVVEKFNK